jgi:hypothetical protein
MSKLTSFLEMQQKALIIAVDAGSKGVVASNLAEMKDDFVSKIKFISRQNRVFLWINVGMVLFVFLASVWLVYHFIDNPKNLSIIFGASGVTIGGMVYYMTYLWRQVVGIEMTIALVDHLKPADLPKIIESLLSTIKKK